MKVKQIKIDFNVTPEIKRFVYVYLITTKTSCILVDSGVYGSQEVIEKAITESGHRPEEVKAVFLTHAHPDHIGTAHYFREKYGAKIYAGEGERPWIEDIDRQFRERPILVDLEDSRKSLETLKNLKNVRTFYPAWDQTYSVEIMRQKIKDARDLLEELEKTVHDIDDGRELSELAGKVCECLHAPMWKKNPLFATTVACCRKEK